MGIHKAYTNSVYSKRQRLSIQEAELRSEVQAVKKDWVTYNDYILERRGRFFTEDVNKGRPTSKIIDATATLASRTLSSGMMSGVTSPARPWFKLQTEDKDKNSKEAVKSYFNSVEEDMRSVFLKSNLYNVLPTLYADMGTFGTGCIFMEEDDEAVVRFTSYPVGSYMIANDRKGRARVFFREFTMTVRQLVDEFGRLNSENPHEITWDNISLQVRSLYDTHQLETQIVICHTVQPNNIYDPNKIDSKYKKFSSDYYEKGSRSVSSQSGGATATGLANTKFLREKGYDFFPALAVRWETTGEDSYGSNQPAAICIGAVKALQLGEKRIAEALDQKVKPSMIGPTSLKSSRASIIAGDITYMDEREGTKGFRRLFEIDFQITELEGKQEQSRQQIRKAYYEDLFLMMAQSDRREITATEVEERHEEKLLALGPVLERMNLDLLDPLVENTYSIMESRELLPEVPEELQESDYNIEYISIMAQAQKIAGIGNIERFAGFVGQIASLDPTMVKKANFDEMIEKYADLLGIPPEMVATSEEMEEIRQQAQQAEQAAQQQESMAAAAETGKNLSETNMESGSALSQLLG